MTTLRMQDCSHETDCSEGCSFFLEGLKLHQALQLGSARSTPTILTGCGPGPALTLIAGSHQPSIIQQENLGWPSLECIKHRKFPCTAQGSLWEEDHTHAHTCTERPGGFGSSPKVTLWPLRATPLENRRPVQSSLPPSLSAAASFISHLHEPWILLKKEVWERLSAEVPSQDCCGYPQHAMCPSEREATQREWAVPFRGAEIASGCHTGKPWAILWSSWVDIWQIPPCSPG